MHGWQRSLADFDPICSLLAESNSSPWVVRFDLPGFGSSPAPESIMGSAQYAEIVREALAETILQMPLSSDLKVVVVGHSFGGRVALCLAAMNGLPFPLSGLLLSGVPLLRPVGTAKKPKLEFRIAKLFFRLGLVSQSRMDKLRDKYGSRDYRAANGLMRDVFVRVVNEDYSDELGRVTVPVLLLWGESDAAAPIALAEQAQEISPELIQLKVVDGDHFVAISNPKILLEAIVSLVQRIES